MGYHELSVLEVQRLFTANERGLDSVIAKERIKAYGLNRLPGSFKLSTLALFFRQFKNPLVYILLVALVISVLTSHWVDAIIVAVVIYVSSVIGFFQEYKAGLALKRLNSLIHYNVKVLRDGKPISLSHEQVVPGDVILISSGDKIPADARLLEVSYFSTIEAPLTGESLPVAKQIEALSQNTPLAERTNMIYAGTMAAGGNATAIVTATGAHTELGKIAAMVRFAEDEQTPLQVQLVVFGRWLGIVLLIINTGIFVIGITTGIPLLEMLMTMVAVVVSAVPEGLIPAMTIILTVGMSKLAKKRGLVRKLIAAETLGSVTVVCADKTGTLTRGEMRVETVITHDAVLTKQSKTEVLHPSVKKVLEIGVMCNAGILSDEKGVIKLSGNPTDKALLFAGHECGIDRDSLLSQLPVLEALPFGPEHKFMATLHASPEKQRLKLIYTKGAPEKVLSFSEFYYSKGTILPMREENVIKIKNAYEELTSQGLRVIGVGFKNIYERGVRPLTLNDMKDFVFTGLVAFRDPLRPEVASAVQQCRKAGIRTVMITGDHKQTAATIANELNMQVLDSEVVEGSDLDKLSDKQLSTRLANIKVFARVEPRHKSRIVSALQQNGEVVAMTGDGVNDSPAMKKSNIGVAMGSGTDISKGVADLVLLDDNFNTIVEAVRRGRIIFDNIRKVMLFLLTDAFSTMVLVGGAVLLGLPLPLLPAQILWMKLAESSLPAMALAFDEIDEGLMKRKPRKKDEPLISYEMKKLIVFYALIMDTLLFVIFYYFWKNSGNLEFARTVTFVALGMNNFFYIFSIRGFRVPVHKLNPVNNKFLLATLVLGMSMILIAVYVPAFNDMLQTIPLGLREWQILITYAVLSIVVYEIGKRLTIARNND